METNFTHSIPPVEHMQDSVESHEVSRLESGVDELMGPVVVGGLYSADCFRHGPGTLQAGRESNSEDFVMSDFNAPRKSPW